jgi:uncharacterized protein
MQPLTNLPPVAYVKLAEEVGVPLVHLVQTIELLEGGATIPFLARYRKEATGNLDEERLRLLERRLAHYRDLEEHRKTVLKAIEEQGKLTAELRAKIEAVLDHNELEDFYLPYKPRKKTRASSAREKGLEPLAEWLYAQRPDGSTPEQAAERFLAPAKGVPDTEQALAGARDILVEWIGEDPDLRRVLRKLAWERAVLVARRSDKADELASEQKEARSRYEAYYDYRKPVSQASPERLLAIRRGVRDGFLAIEVELDEAAPLEPLLARLVRDRASGFAPQLETAAQEAWRRLLHPSLLNEIRAALKDRADEEALRQAQESLRTLLLAPPAGAIAVLGIDPGYRNGCQVAVVDASGKFLEGAAVYPHEPKYDTAGARAALKDLLVKHEVRAVAIGNGAASRETDHFIRALLRDEKLENVFSIVVNEAGSVTYSTSRLAKEEFPELEPPVRSAISIARRLQDPLAELVKIEPRALAAGQYQHDVDPESLAGRLQATVESCVNQVGVDPNAASAPQLRCVAGITERVARRIVEYRQANGLFTSLEQLRQVPGFVDRIFEQASGFLRLGNQDPRGPFVVPQYQNDILVISDLKEGMEVEGVVSNITTFGAFVDVGVHQDGLVHVSELSGKFIKDPHDAVKVGDRVKVRVLSADPAARRISLSMKPPPPPKVERPPRPSPAASAPPSRDSLPTRDSLPSRDLLPSRDRKGADKPPEKKSAKPKPMSLDEKLAILSTKFRTRV